MDRYPLHIQTHVDDEAATALVCIECLRPWLVGSERWRLKVTDDPVPVTVPYCPECAHREFD